MIKKVVVNFNIGSINQKIIYIDENDCFTEESIPLGSMSETIAKKEPKEVVLVGPEPFLERYKNQIKNYSITRYANNNIKIEIKETM